jgi:hypothetical protein
MGGGGGTTTTTSKVDTGPWGAQQGYLKDVFASASDLYHKNPSPTYYPDSTVSPFTPGQTQGYQDIVNKGLTGSPFMTASGQNATDTLSGKYLDPSSNPWLTNTFDTAADAVTRQFKTATAPTTDAMFSGNGAYNGSARYNAQNNNNLGLGTTLNGLATSIFGGNYANERQNQLATQGLVPSLASARYIDPTAAAGAGGAQQAQQQAELSDQVNRYNFNQQSPWQTLGQYKSLVDGSYGQQGTTTSQQPYYSNGLGQALGGGLGLLGTIGSLAMPGAGGVSAFGNIFSAFSDVRLKEDIHPVGKTNDGQNLYLYRYKGDTEPRVGLMAQEVERRDPGAVTEHPSGFKMVDYARALGPSIFMLGHA